MISELSTAMILYTGRTQTLTVAIYTQIIRGNYGIAAGHGQRAHDPHHHFPADFQQAEQERRNTM